MLDVQLDSSRTLNDRLKRVMVAMKPSNCWSAVEIDRVCAKDGISLRFDRVGNWQRSLKRRMFWDDLRHSPLAGIHSFAKQSGLVGNAKRVSSQNSMHWSSASVRGLSGYPRIAATQHSSVQSTPLKILIGR